MRNVTKQGFVDYTDYSKKPRVNRDCMADDHKFSEWIAVPDVNVDADKRVKHDLVIISHVCEKCHVHESKVVPRFLQK